MDERYVADTVNLSLGVVQCASLIECVRRGRDLLPIYHQVSGFPTGFFANTPVKGTTVPIWHMSLKMSLSTFCRVVRLRMKKAEYLG